jgi:hypothetical protein
MKDSQRLSRKLGMVGISLCMACYLFPIVTVTFGVGALTAISAYMTWFGIIAMILAVAFFGIYYYRKSRAPACDVACGCKERNNVDLN